MTGLNEWGEGYIVTEHKRNGEVWTETIWIIKQRKNGEEISRQPHSMFVRHEFRTLEEALLCGRRAWEEGRTALIERSTDARGDGSSHRYVEVSVEAFSRLMSMANLDS